MKGWIGVDLDGTLAHYDGWQGDTHIGAPIWPMVHRVQRWLSQGQVVRIFTARVSEPDLDRRKAIIEAIQIWCLNHIGLALEVTCVKDYGMVELWDDRAVAVLANTGEQLNPSRRGLV